MDRSSDASEDDADEVSEVTGLAIAPVVRLVPGLGTEVFEANIDDGSLTASGIVVLLLEKGPRGSFEKIEAAAE